jgi:hypothetical protein
MRVGQISGDNFQKGTKRGDADYYFSIYNHIWGWASWANRWKNYDISLNTIKDLNFIDDLIPNKNTNRYWKSVFVKTKNLQKIVTWWDYQWTFTLWNQNQLTILPNVNLISNVGFGADATHTTGDSEFSKLIAHELILKTHPLHVRINKEADDFTSKLMFEKKSFFYRTINKIRRLIK